MELRLAGLSEVADILGISRQRTMQLKATEVFPQPVATLKCGDIYLVSDIEEYGRTRNKKRGRPVRGSNETSS